VCQFLCDLAKARDPKSPHKTFKHGYGEGLDDLLGAQAADAVMQGLKKDLSPEELHLQRRSRFGMLPDKTHSLRGKLLQLGIGLEGIQLLSDPGIPEPAGLGPQPSCQLSGLGRGRKMLEIIPGPRR